MLGFEVGGYELGDIHKGFPRGFQAFGDGYRVGTAVFQQLRFGGFDLRGDALGGLCAVTGGFTTDQIVGLNGGCAFVNRQNFGIAVVLRYASFFDKAHAAVNLHAQRSDFQTHLGAITFDERHEEFIKRLICLAGFGIGVVVGGIVGGGGNAGHCAATFGVGTHGHEHTADIGMLNDGAALYALTGVADGCLVRTLGNRNALHAHAITRGIHHDEHVFQTAIFFPNQITHCATVITELQHGGGAGFDAHFVFDADAMHVVTRTQRTIAVHQEFGNHEQADAFHARRSALHPCQHQVNDVFGYVMLTPRNENLRAEDFVRAITLGFGAAAHGG